jgi:hypothetical protein
MSNNTEQAKRMGGQFRVPFSAFNPHTDTPAADHHF